jgi:hypothetical protein
MTKPDHYLLLSDFFIDFLGTCLDEGMTSPFYVVAIGTNGYMGAFRADQNADSGHLDLTPLIKHKVKDTVQPPIFVVAIDPAAGVGLSGRIEPDGVNLQ